MSKFLRIFLTMFVILFFASIATECSCEKKPGGGGNGGNNNSNDNANSGNGSNASCTGICPTKSLVLRNGLGQNWIKISGNTVVINAARLAGEITPHSDTDPNNRGFDDVSLVAGRSTFDVIYPSHSGAVVIFVNRTSVSTNNITIPATVTGCQSSETADEALATSASGSLCREYNPTGGTTIGFNSYLGTVFNNTDTANHARGIMRCTSSLAGTDTAGLGREVITDALVINRDFDTSCYIAVVNSGGAAAAAEIDDAWVGDAASTTEVELYAIVIDFGNKTIPQFSDAAGYGLSEFIKVHDNAAFKRLLKNNPWGELKFKVKIVTAANF